MEFKGNIGCGTLKAEFFSDAGNADPDLLIMTFAAIGGGSAQHDREAVAPGGSVTAELEVSENGVLHVMVATGQDPDGGRLVVSQGETVRSDETIQGPVDWVYSVAC